MSPRIWLPALAVAVCAFGPPQGAQAADWAKIEAKKVMLFYPAQTPWERLMVRDRHTGVRRYREGKNCASCHADIDEHPLGDSLVDAERFKEPEPIFGKPPWVDLMVKTARDAENVYVQIQFDPGEQPDAGQDKQFETKVALMIDDGKVEEFNRGGCWVLCHDSVIGMPRATPATTQTKFVMASRQDVFGLPMKEPAELAKMRADGQFVEYWQAKLNKGAAALAVDGTILDKRSENEKPAVAVEATQDAKGAWTVTFKRKLTGIPGHKDLTPGQTYNIGFSVHAGHTHQRFHYVSFERTLMLDKGEADFVAAQ